MDLTNIITIIAAALVAFTGGFMARPKTRADAHKTEVEAADLIVHRLYAEITRLDAQLVSLRELLVRATAESEKLCGHLTSARDEVILLRERMDKAARELDAGQPGKAEETLKKVDNGGKA